VADAVDEGRGHLLGQARIALARGASLMPVPSMKW
jgi:hypothetical protein